MWGVTFLFITDGLCRKGEGMEEEMFCRHITKDLVHTLPPDNRDLKIRAGFAFFQTSSRLFQLTFFVKYRRTFQEVALLRTIPKFRQIKGNFDVAYVSIKREIRHFYVVYV